MKYFLAIAFALALSVTVRADAIYSYTGNQFTGNTGTDCNSSIQIPICTSPNGKIVGTVTLAQLLAPNMSLTTVTPLSFLFSGAGLTLGNNSPQLQSVLFQFGTDALGHIIDWNVLISQFGATQRNLEIIATTPSQDHGGDEPGTNLFNTNSPGVWTMNPTPEPGTVLLLTSGIVWIGIIRRRLK